MPRRTIRTSRASLVIIDLTRPQPFCHRPRLKDQRPHGKCPPSQLGRAKMTWERKRSRLDSKCGSMRQCKVDFVRGRRPGSPEPDRQMGRRCAEVSALRWVTITDIVCRLPWTGSWTGASDNPSATSAISAITRVICAARVRGAWGRTSCKRQVIDSDPDVSQQARLSFFVVA